MRPLRGLQFTNNSNTTAQTFNFNSTASYALCPVAAPCTAPAADVTALGAALPNGLRLCFTRLARTIQPDH